MNRQKSDLHDIIMIFIKLPLLWTVSKIYRTETQPCPQLHNVSERYLTILPTIFFIKSFVTKYCKHYFS